MNNPPENYENIGDIMSNFDHKIIDGAEEKLKSGPFCGQYPGWNFFGKVWYDKESKIFKCVIWQFSVRINTIQANTLEEMMKIACRKWGSD